MLYFDRIGVSEGIDVNRTNGDMFGVTYTRMELDIYH